jgi:hypothetical protein
MVRRTDRHRTSLLLGAVTGGGLRSFASLSGRIDMVITMPYSTFVWIDSGNHRPELVIGQIRNLANEFGWPGIEAKRGQTNSSFFAQGVLSLTWPNRQLARRYKAAVEEL